MWRNDYIKLAFEIHLLNRVTSLNWFRLTFLKEIYMSTSLGNLTLTLNIDVIATDIVNYVNVSNKRGA